jgi:DNA-binding response OmpR family regulator
MGAKILVVSDDPRVTDAARYAFPSDVEVELARDAREALASMKESVPSAVVVDLQTGSAGGFALARDMKQDRRLETVPILMLLERDQDAWLARQAGANRLRTKPLDVSELVFETLSLI